MGKIFGELRKIFGELGKLDKLKKAEIKPVLKLKKTEFEIDFFIFFTSISNSNPVLINFNTVLISVFFNFSMPV